jgi:hypothetical protein
MEAAVSSSPNEDGSYLTPVGCGGKRSATGMTTRSVAGYALLVLAAFFVAHVALDAASVRASSRQQWRAPTHHEGVARLPRRSNGIPAAAPAVWVPSGTGSVSLADCPDVTAPFPADVFVPPRV